MAFQVEESGDGADDDVIFGDAELLADDASGHRGGEKWRGFHSAVDGDVLIGCADVGGEGLVAHGIGDADHFGGDGGGVAFEELVHAVDEGVGGGGEGQAVDGVDDDGDGGGVGGPAADDSGFAAVGVNDIGLEFGEAIGQVAIG